jgi:membrane protein YdbS with pleckstrin-like domain
VDALFAPPVSAWQRVSPRLAHARRLALLLTLGPGLLIVLALGLFDVLPGWVVGLGSAALVAGAGYGWWLVGRVAARWGYAEAEEELYITRGAVYRRLVVVPYGRMQYVDAQAGPLDQLNGIASVRLHTASPGTSAVIPGLPAEEAARLRDRLTALGESSAAGL